jgi:rod shape-determining protein MreC
MAVISSGVLVGTVDKVEDFSSTVFLSSDPEFKIRGIGQDGRAQGIVNGQLGQGYLFDKITLAESLSNNELVITAGTGLVPKGILIGQVESIQKSDNAVFQSAQLSPLVNTSNLEIVFIVKGLKQ